MAEDISCTISGKPFHYFKNLLINELPVSVLSNVDDLIPRSVLVRKQPKIYWTDISINIKTTHELMIFISVLKKGTKMFVPKTTNCSNLYGTCFSVVEILRSAFMF